MEYYASLRTKGAIEAAEVTVLLLDASEPISEQDLRVATQVAESGRALVLAMNKWDLVDDDRRDAMKRELERGAGALPVGGAGQHLGEDRARGAKLAPAMRTALENWDRRIPTGQLNQWLADIVAATPPPVRGGKQPKILYATQAQNRPPTFVLFTSGFLEASYRRFLERKLRETFPLTGTPIQINMRVREKRKKS